MSKIIRLSLAKVEGYFSGSQTCSALLGVGSEALSRSGLDKAVLDREMGIIPVCYAVTYAVSNILLVIWGLLTVILI